jgi:hypothetical protein
MVLQRTLRRQAQEFLDRPFTQRRCRLYEYAMSDDERLLYDDVTEYLLQPSLYAFAGRQRRLLLIGFHRRMASSIPALASSLQNVATRLRRLQSGLATEETVIDVYRDLEDEDELEDTIEETVPAADPPVLAAELARVEDFISRAKSLPDDAKARSFKDAIRVVLDLGKQGAGSGKAVVFTESITTQEYLRRLLLDTGLQDEEITLFRGVNDHQRAKQAYVRWQEEEAGRFPPGARPSREVAVRLALVHEFRTRSKVLICTEAGAKGLNLQFCETVINYDLPWNPQRIEQRIGRCHRYSQQRDVTVVNFIARDNDAHRLTFEILSQKLDLFGKVLDATDTVLHEPRTDTPELAASALSVEVETDLRNIYSRSRTLDEVTREIAALRDRIAERRDAYEKEYLRTSQIIESHLHQDVRRVFNRLREDLPRGLAELDRDIERLVESYLSANGIRYRRDEHEGRIIFELDDGSFGRRFATGDARGLTDAEPLNLVHPLVQRAIGDARNWQGGDVLLHLPPGPNPDLSALAGKTGVMRLVLVKYGGFEPVEHIVAAATVDADVVAPDIAAKLARLEASDASGLEVRFDPGLLTDALDEALFTDQREIEADEQKHFEQAIGQLERFVQDKVLVCRRERAAIQDKLRAATARRDDVVGASARQRVESDIQALSIRDENLEHRIEALESRQDEVYKKWRDRYHELRYEPPAVRPLLEARFRIVQANPETSC